MTVQDYEMLQKGVLGVVDKNTKREHINSLTLETNTKLYEIAIHLFSSEGSAV